jgi:ketosteroid isomerase-like protein
VVLPAWSVAVIVTAAQDFGIVGGRGYDAQARLSFSVLVQKVPEILMQQAVRKYLQALEAGDADSATALFVADGWVQSPFLGRLPVRDFIEKVASASGDSKLTVHDVLVSAEGHLRAVAYYLYDWSLKDGSRVSFDCADVFNFDLNTGRIASVVLVYDTHLVRGVIDKKYP